MNVESNCSKEFIGNFDMNLINRNIVIIKILKENLFLMIT
jgi:hypothetical protein